MPNSPGRGIYGYPREGDGSHASAATAVFAVKPAATLFSPVTWVYEWCNGAWILAWGATVTPPPAGVPTATYVPAGTQVHVTWTAPTQNIADSWVIRRPDGSVAGTVPVGTLAFDDLTPLPGVGAYTIEGVNGGSVSTRTPTNVLTIDLRPATATAVATSSSSATVTWTENATQGDPDQWRIFNASTGGWASGFLPGTQHSVAIGGLTPGTINTFRVYPYLSGVASNFRDTAAVSLAPLPPAGVTLRATTRNLLNLRWSHPGGAVTTWELQVYDASTGPWIGVGNDASGNYTIVRTQNSYMRLRSVAPGGVSAWVQVGPVQPLVEPYDWHVAVQDFGPIGPPPDPENFGYKGWVSYLIPGGFIQVEWEWFVNGAWQGIIYSYRTPAPQPTFTANNDGNAGSQPPGSGVFFHPNSTPGNNYVRFRVTNNFGSSLWVQAGPI